ncbi:MAG: chloride channel protein, partial [Clostridium celatum]|nr:chloride channel protein [Clostridium celatum]
FGAFYNWFTLKTQNLYAKLKCSTSTKLIIPFLLSGILGLLFPVVLCGGHAVIEELNLSTTLSLLLLILVAKFLFSMISFGSGAPGGIFFPLLIIGGTFGAVFGYISINYLGISPELFNNFIILSMAGYFTAIVRAPITGIILITEMTGSFTHLLSLTIVSIIAYIVADLLKSVPIYDSLLENLLLKNNINEYHSHSNKKLIITNVVHFGSKIEKTTLNSLNLPENTLIVSIKRGEDSIVPKGNTIIRAGDTILTMTDLKDEWKVRELMDSLTTLE